MKRCVKKNKRQSSRKTTEDAKKSEKKNLVEAESGTKIRDFKYPMSKLGEGRTVKKYRFKG